MNDLIDDTKLEGECLIKGKDIYDKSINIDALRKDVGMVFKTQSFSQIRFENVAYGLKVNGITDKSLLLIE